VLEVLRGRVVLGGELAHFAAGHVHERLLLGFWRWRAFYRDPDSALEPLWADLRQHDILPALRPQPGLTS